MVKMNDDLNKVKQLIDMQMYIPAASSLRQILEAAVQELIGQHDLWDEFRDKERLSPEQSKPGVMKMIDFVGDAGLISEADRSGFHKVRMMGNSAIHEGSASREECLAAYYIMSNYLTKGSTDFADVRKSFFGKRSKELGKSYKDSSLSPPQRMETGSRRALESESADCHMTDLCRLVLGSFVTKVLFCLWPR